MKQPGYFFLLAGLPVLDRGTFRCNSGRFTEWTA
jgi:hypothetical protein